MGSSAARPRQRQVPRSMTHLTRAQLPGDTAQLLFLGFTSGRFFNSCSPVQGSGMQLCWSSLCRRIRDRGCAALDRGPAGPLPRARAEHHPPGPTAPRRRRADRDRQGGRGAYGRNPAPDLWTCSPSCDVARTAFGRSPPWRRSLAPSRHARRRRRGPSHRRNPARRRANADGNFDRRTCEGSAIDTE